MTLALTLLPMLVFQMKVIRCIFMLNFMVFNVVCLFVPPRITKLVQAIWTMIW